MVAPIVGIAIASVGAVRLVSLSPSYLIDRDSPPGAWPHRRQSRTPSWGAAPGVRRTVANRSTTTVVPQPSTSCKVRIASPICQYIVSALVLTTPCARCWGAQTRTFRHW